MSTGGMGAPSSGEKNGDGPACAPSFQRAMFETERTIRPSGSRRGLSSAGTGAVAHFNWVYASEGPIAAVSASWSAMNGESTPMNEMFGDIVLAIGVRQHPAYQRYCPFEVNRTP